MPPTAYSIQAWTLCNFVSYADLNVYGWDLGLPAKTEISCNIARCIMRYHAISHDSSCDIVRYRMISHDIARCIMRYRTMYHAISHDISVARADSKHGCSEWVGKWQEHGCSESALSLAARSGLANGRSMAALSRL